MKKIYLFLSAAVLSLMGLFTACEDVPAPYGIEDEELENVPGQEGILLEESFAASFGRFQNFTTSGEGAWKIDYGTAKASGFDFDSKVNTAGVYYLVSPEVELPDTSAVHLTYEYILAYKNRVPNGNKLFVTDNFDAAKADQNWTELKVEHLEADRKDDGKIDWKAFKTIDVQIPEEFAGKTIRFAFYHECTSSGSTTMEIKNVKLALGKAAEGGEDKPEVEEGVKDLPYAESFASEMGAFKSYTTEGEGQWIMDNRGFAKASGFAGKDMPAIQGVYYMVSPEISLAGKTEVHFSYEYINSFNDNPLNHQFVINPAFDESKPAEGWVALKADHEKTSSWTDWKKADIQIPAEYMGKNVRVAFRYECSTERASTFEVKNFNAAEGKAESGEVTPQPGEGVQQLPYNEAFSSTLGLFKNFTTSGAGEWVIDFGTAKASGYSNGSTTDGTYYLVSPEISLSGQTEAHVMYDYIYRYAKGDDNQQVLISTSFDEANPAENWTLLNNQHTEGVDWKTFSKADIQIPAEYMGKTIRLALRYNCENQSGSTWEVKNFSIAAGKVGEGGNEGGGTPDVGDKTAPNGDFECWVDGMPNNWQSASSASKGNLFQSDDFHSGKYSVQVGGSTTGNMRLAYKETNLKAGQYTMTFYVKAVTGEGGSVVPGYVQVTDGAVGSYMYKKVDGKMAYEDNLSNKEWRKVEYSFELSEEGLYCMVIMNGKNPGKDVLVDDFTLIDTEGNEIIK